jgi:hypothetical protein
LALDTVAASCHALALDSAAESCHEELTRPGLGAWKKGHPLTPGGEEKQYRK